MTTTLAVARQNEPVCSSSNNNSSEYHVDLRNVSQGKIDEEHNSEVSAPGASFGGKITDIALNGSVSSNDYNRGEEPQLQTRVQKAESVDIEFSYC